MSREEIVAGLKRWARGSLPAQAAVKFLAATDEPLSRMWVRETDMVSPVPVYWLDWEEFDKYAGALSGGEYATWALARSLHRGELDEYLFRLDPSRTAAFAAAIRDEQGQLAMTRKTAVERENINARAKLFTAGTTAKIRAILAEPAELERGTIERAVERAFILGWSAGIKDYTEGE